MSHIMLVAVVAGLVSIPAAPVREPAPEPAMSVRSVVLSGSCVVDRADLLAAMELPPGPSVTFLQLQRAVRGINREYASRGYAFCGVLSNSQIRYDPASQTLTIRVVEPRLRAVRWLGTPAGEPDALMDKAGLHDGEVPRTEAIIRLMQAAARDRNVSPPRPRLTPDGAAIDLEFEVR